MINEPVIVGCGTIGSLLALKLSEKRLSSKLKIYDFDKVSFSENYFYPFNMKFNGISKIQIITFLCKKLNQDLLISGFEQKITKPFNTNEFIIDSRDCKRPNINANIQLSVDGSLLYIDSRRNKETSKEYYHYVYPKNFIVINHAIDIILKYLINDNYIYCDYRFYDLITDKCIIIEGDNLYGSVN